jgi:hypothetical protein
MRDPHSLQSTARWAWVGLVAEMMIVAWGVGAGIAWFFVK